MISHRLATHVSSRALTPLALALSLLALVASPALAAPPDAGDLAPPLGIDELVQAPDDAIATWDALAGRTVILEFWGTWCFPCVAAFPHINDLASRFADRDLTFIAITDEDPDIVAPFLIDNPLKTWVAVSRDRKAHQTFGVTSWPTTIIVGPDRRIIARTYPTELTAEKLEAILDGQTPAMSGSNLNMGAGYDPDIGPDEPRPEWRVLIRRETSHETTRLGGPEGPITARGFSLGPMLAHITGVPRFLIRSDRPLPTERYTWVVNPPPGKMHESPRMLLGAISTTFGISVRVEERSIPVYVLERGDGPRAGLKPAPDGGSSIRTMYPTGELSVSYREGGGGEPVSTVAKQLQAAFKRPVYDETGVEGRFTWDLRYDPEDTATLIDVLREEMGFELREERRVERVLIVTSDDGGGNAHR